MLPSAGASALIFNKGAARPLMPADGLPQQLYKSCPRGLFISG